MNCKYHKDSEAKYICEKCKQPVCDDCITDVAGRKVCSSCVQQVLFQPEQQRPARSEGFMSKVIFFGFSLFPGAAHMYMAQFRRGIQLMLSFLGTIFILSYVNFESMAAFLAIPIWFFSFFDSHHLRRKIKNGDEVEDVEAFDYSILLKNKLYLGIGILILGVMGFFNSFQYAFNGFDGRFWHYFNSLFYSLRRAMIPLLLIFIGAYLVNKARKAALPNEEAIQDNVFSIDNEESAVVEEEPLKARIGDTVEEIRA